MNLNYIHKKLEVLDLKEFIYDIVGIGFGPSNLALAVDWIRD